MVDRSDKSLYFDSMGEVYVGYDVPLPRQITPEQRAARWPKAEPGPTPEVMGAGGLSARLAWARARAGLAYKALAVETGYSAAALQKWESGETSPTVIVTEHLARVLGIRSAWLAFGVGPVEVEVEG